MDTTAEFTFSLGYIITSICLIVPPREIASLGFTLQNIFSFYLGVEDVHFITFHLRRTALTAMFHSILPFGYYVSLGLISTNFHLFDLEKNGLLAKMFLVLSVGLVVYTILLVRYWSWNKWSNHPLVKTLQRHGSPWIDVAAQINIEFRRIDKFSSHIGGTSIYITDSWIVKCTAYHVYIAHKPDIHMNILKAEDHSLSVETNSAVQFLNIEVVSINTGVKPFVIRLNSLDYSELREKIQNPIRNARNVVIHESLSDQFVKAFKEQIEQNEKYLMDEGAEEPEPCIGCMRQQANVKLHKLCDGECVPCFCRPMWCLDCMGKWFASRQDRTSPGTWMASSCPCPTCRATFCILDVCLLA